MKKQKRILTAGLLLASGSALAHSGAGESGLMMGLTHPLGGLDHLMAMLTVGVWAATLDHGRRQLLVPAAFVLFMAAGAMLGVAGFGFPLMEVGIAFSVLFMGLLLLSGARLSLGIAALLVGGFALLHGNAHGLEAGASTAMAAYFAGFLVSTVLLHVTGLLLGRQLLAREWVVRGLGLITGVIGTGLLLGT